MKTLNKLINLSNTGLLSINGEEAKKFLQGQLTCHLEEVTLTQSTLAARCNIQGRVRALFRLSLFPLESGSLYVIRLPSSMLTSLLKDLKQYAIFSKVQLEDLSTTYSTLGLVGETAPTLLQEVLGEEIDLMLNQCSTVNFQQTILQICRIPGEIARFEIIGPQSAITTLEKNLQSNCEIAMPELWDYYDIQAGIPAIYPETQDQFLPHHLNLVNLGAINFKKGCYLGQEIIARMHYKGKIKKGLYHLLSDKCAQLPKPYDRIVTKSAPENETAGHVVSSYHTATGCELLAVLDNESAQQELYLYTMECDPLRLYLA